jgi:hypothetical protein
MKPKNNLSHPNKKKNSLWFASEQEIIFQLCVVQLLALLLQGNVEIL